MALIDCSECGEQVSEKADACPNCGAPVDTGGGVEHLQKKVRGEKGSSQQEKERGGEKVNQGENKGTSKRLVSGCILALVGVIVLLIVVGNLVNEGDGQSEDYDPDWAGATTACETFVERRLKSPSSAEFPWATTMEENTENLGGGKFRVRAYVDAENSFGAKLRRNFVCVVQYQGNDWQLERLNIRE